MLRRAQLRALLVLRARLTLRLFIAEQGRIVVLLMVVAVALPLALGLGFGTGVGYLQLPQPWPGQLLAGVLVALWLAWLLIPLVAFSLNEGMDITRLLVYPLSKTELLVTMLLGTLFDIPTYLMLPLFVAIVVGWVASPALFVLLPALLLVYAQMVLSSQILVTALGGILASRRFRDVLIVGGAVLGSSCYLLQRGFQALLERYVEPQQLASIRPLLFLRWLPGGNQAQTIVSAAAGDWGGALLWLGYGLIVVALLAWVWWQISLRLVTGNGFMLTGFGRSGPNVRAKKRRVAPQPGWLPADIQQLAAKELRLIWRTPQRRVGLLQGLLFPLIVVGFSLVSGGLPQALPPWLGLLIPVFGIFTTWIAGQNALGVEEKGLPLVLLTPLPRHRFWLGKSLVTFALSVLPTILLGLVLLVLLPGWQSLVGVIVVPGAVLTSLAVVNLGSIVFPYPVRTDGKQVRSSTKGGLISGLGNGLILPATIALTNGPTALFLLGSQLLDAPWLGYLGALFALIYGGALFYGLGVIFAGRLMLRREAELVAATRPPEAE